MKIVGNKTNLLGSLNQVVAFLKDANNIELLLPSEEINNFKADEFGCSFGIKGGVTISLLHASTEVKNQLKYVSGPKAPFNYTLIIDLEEQNDGTIGQMTFDATINMFIKMMVEKPLTQLFEGMGEKLQKQFNN